MAIDINCCILTREINNSFEIQPKPLLRNEKKQIFEKKISLAIETYLIARMGKPTFKAINYHLQDVVGIDLSQIATSPSIIEEGLQKIFGAGAYAMVRACIYAAFRTEGIIPDREYRGLADAFSELGSRVSVEVLQTSS